MAPVDKKSKTLVHRAPIITDPQMAVGEYLQSKQEERRIRKYPEWDVARATPAAELVKARRELTLAETDLTAKRAEQVEKRKIMDQQWSELRKKENLLRQSFIKFNKFAKENYAKRERAELKIKEELEHQAKRKEEIEEMTRKLNYMKDVRENVKKHVSEYKMYQTYLERVVNETGQFQSVAEIFSRYESLIEARATLSGTQEQNLQALEDTGNEMTRLTEEKSKLLIGLNNKLAQLQVRHDKSKADALKWETMVSRIKAVAAAKNLEFTQMKVCCWNIYRQICKRKEIPVEIDRDDVEHQLVHIKRTILELKRIAKVAKKKAKEIEATGRMATDTAKSQDKK